MNELSYNASESSRYPYKICPTKPPIKILHDILFEAPDTPRYNGIITFPQRGLENIIAFKINFFYSPPNAGGGTPTSGQIYLLRSNILASLLRTNQLWISTSDGTTTNTNAEPVSSLIAYGTNLTTANVFSSHDNNNVQFLSHPYRIQQFDWQVVNLVTQAEPSNNAFNEVAFEISFFYACDCNKY